MGATIGITAVLHTWGSAMTHHPHVQMIVPGGTISRDGQRWVACPRPRFIIPVRVLSKLFRRLMLEKLIAAHAAGKLQFFGGHAHLAKAHAFTSCPGTAQEKEVVRIHQGVLRRAPCLATLKKQRLYQIRKRWAS
jgi:hypothetical protein